MNIIAYFQSAIKASLLLDTKTVQDNAANNTSAGFAFTEPNEKRIPLFVFPNAYLRQYWTSALAKSLICVGLDSFVTFSKLQQLLQIECSQDDEKPKRFLSPNERLVMASLLLQDTRAQAFVLQIEQLTSAQISMLDFSAQYAHTLLQLLDQFIVFIQDYENGEYRAQDEPREVLQSNVSRTYSQQFINALNSLIVLYDSLLAKYNCIDGATCNYRLYLLQQQYTQDSHKINTHTLQEPSLPQTKGTKRTLFDSYSIQILFPELLKPPQKLWLEYFGIRLENSELGQASEDFAKQDMGNTRADINNSAMFIYEELPVSSIREVVQAQTYTTLPLHLAHRIVENSAQERVPLLYKYHNVTQEFESIFSAISLLLDKGVNPEDISLSVCNPSQAMNLVLRSIANKYAVPISLDTNINALVKQFVNLVDSVIQSNFSPPVLQALLLDLAFPWKDRESNLAIIKIGMAGTCFNDTSLTRWKHLLSLNDFTNKTQLYKYFSDLAWGLKNISKATSFAQLYVKVNKFIATFFEGKFRKLGEYGADTKSFVNALLIEIEAHLVFEKYLNLQKINTNNNKNTGGIRYVESPWNTVAKIIEGKDIMTRTAKYASVQVHYFPETLASNFAYQFICNLSQTAIVNASAHQSIFNDFLAQRYDSSTLITLYEVYRKNIIATINNTQHFTNTYMYLSGSEQGLEKVQSLPIYWDTVKVENHAHISDIWQIETQYWKSHKPVKQELMLTKQQLLGLAHQKLLKLNADKSSLLFKGLDKALFAKVLAYRKCTISVTSIARLCNPSQFFFEYILGAVPLMDAWDYSMHEQRTWGSLYHKLLEQNISSGRDDSNVANVNSTQETLDTQKEYLLSLVKKLHIHDYLWDSYVEGLAQFPLAEHIDRIVSILRAENISNFLTEQRLKYPMLDLVNILQDGDVFSKHSSYAISKEIFESIEIAGKVDLAYVQEHQLTKIIDYKYKSRGTYLHKLSMLFQPWIYYLFMNKEQVLQNQLTNGLSVFNSMLNKDKIPAQQSPEDIPHVDCAAMIYFVTEDPQSNLLVYPPQGANPKQEKENKHINTRSLLFGNTLLVLMHRFSHLYKGQTTLQVPDNPIVQEIIERMSPELSFSTKLVIREGCYAYIK